MTPLSSHCSSVMNLTDRILREWLVAKGFLQDDET
jgi:hypothetical protein